MQIHRVERRAIADRVAGAPISWGVCEVEGWGYQLDRERVLDEMRGLGLRATEFGPVGFLPDDPRAKAALLADHGMTAVGGFLVSLLHDKGSDPLPEFDEYADSCIASGAGVVVVAAHSGVNGYDDRPVLDGGQWATLVQNLDRLHDRGAERGVTAVIHPHIGTMVETADEVERVLAGSRIGLCVDTGHLMAAGTDPVTLTRNHTERVAHVHLKDVDGDLARAVTGRSLTFSQAVAKGLFRPLGQGDVDVAAMVFVLEAAGYEGWYVLEQDVMLDGEPDGAGPVVNVQASLDYLMGLPV